MNTVEKVDPMTDAESARPSSASLTEQVNSALRMATDQELQAAMLLRTPGLRITSVKYGLTVNTGNYSSVRLDAEAAVPMASLAESTYAELEKWVRSQSPCSIEYLDKQREAKLELELELRLLQQRIEGAEREYARFKKAFDMMGVTPGLPAPEDLPF